MSRFPCLCDVNDRTHERRYAVPWSAWLELSVFSAVALATVLAFLNGRAWDRPEGAEHAAVTLLWLQQHMATGAFVEPLTGIGRHRLFSTTPAFWTGDGGFQEYICHSVLCSNSGIVDNPVAKATDRGSRGDSWGYCLPRAWRGLPLRPPLLFLIVNAGVKLTGSAGLPLII
jgi:hypothetical protein